VLTGANETFSGGTVDGSKFLYTEGTTAVSGLTIGGTVELENTNAVNQSAGNVTLGDNIASDEAILYNTSKATYDLLDDSGIALGTSTASYIDNAGLFKKTGGTGASVIAPAVTNTGAIEVTAATLDVQGAVSETGKDKISGSSRLEFDSTVAAGQTVSFTGSGGTLDLGAPQGFAGTISGFDTVGANHTIEVAAPWSYTGFTENAGGTQGTLGFVSSLGTSSLTLIGDYNPADFHQTQANGSTLITYTGVGLDSLLRPVSGAETHAGEFGIREASGSAHGDWGAGASWDGSTWAFVVSASVLKTGDVVS
jgi:large repetitive protein